KDMNASKLVLHDTKFNINFLSDTFLGTMFQERNRSLLIPKNGNEYFIDRSGQIFYYIMQFYRTGKINIDSRVGPISINPKEIEIELDYFQIPRPTSSTIDKIVISKVNALVNTFKELIKEVAEYFMMKNSFKNFSTYIVICFLDNGQATVNAGLEKSLTDIFESTKHFAYNIMSIYKDEVKKYLKTIYPELTWDDEHIVGSVQYYKIRLTIDWNLNYGKILGNSCMSLLE
ncbi:13201_t:CDS:2, partial [Funneliformis mosseae]